MRAVLIAWLLCCAGWPGVCAAVPGEKFKLLAYDQPPYTEADADGTPKGAAVEMVQIGSGMFSRLDYASHDEWSFRKLIMGRVDAVITGRQAGMAMLKKLDATASVRIVGPPLDFTESYIMFDKSAVYAGFLRRFNAAMALMRKDGSASRIRVKYGLQ